jgi:hypothetical protein
MRHLLAVAVTSLFTCQVTQAADISLVLDGTPTHPAIIFIHGAFRPDSDIADIKNFATIAEDQKYGAIVFLESQGGLLMTGTWIGREIKKRGFITAVANNAVCSSACAIAWLGGKERFMDPRARVGFHAARKWPWMTNEIDTHGNTVVSLYLRDIGFTDPGVARYLTSAPPVSMTWVKLDDLARYGIVAQYLDLPRESRSWARVTWPFQPNPKRTNPPNPTEDLFMKWMDRARPKA